MNILLIIMGILGGTIGVLMLFYVDYADKEPNTRRVLNLSVALILTVVGFSVFGIFLQKDAEKKKSFSTKDYIIKEEIGRDTLYIFTPKKKK